MLHFYRERFIIRNIKYLPVIGTKKLLVPISVIIYIILAGYTVKSKGINYDSESLNISDLYIYNQQEFQDTTFTGDSARVLRNAASSQDSAFESTDTTGFPEIDTIETGKTSNLFENDTASTTADTSIFAADDSVDISDTTFALQSDTLTPYDSLWLDPRAQDSTARLHHFKYQREPEKGFRFDAGKQSKFFLYPKQPYTRRVVELDSTGQYVLIKEVIPGQEDKLYLKLPLDEYIRYKLEAERKSKWRQIGGKYEFDDGKTELTDLLSDITNIEIPLPSTSFLSIFGPPRINLNISGSVDIMGAWRNETTEGVTASALGNTRNEPDFKQQVQINVRGTIGDKLKISADWNTERTFEYENQLKIQYEGYEDEIIQSIEAGNVSLQTSSLVGGSEALFGVKALFQFGPFTLTALASQKKGEVQEVSVTGGSEKQSFEIRAYDYSTNHYFLDKIYADPELNIFNEYYGNETPNIFPQYRVKDIEVWKTTDGLTDKSRERKANAYIDLDAIFAGESYPDELRDITTQNEIPGRTIIGGRFIRLEREVDYTLHEETGYISFRSQIQDQDAIAVAYRVENGAGSDDDYYYGEFLGSESAQDTSQIMILKLVKPKNLKPGGDYEQAWRLQLKNIYPIGGRDIKEEEFELQIKYEEDTGNPKSDYAGLEYVTAFGLDKTNQDGTSSQPDGAFDFKPNKTIFINTGEIIFPTLEPFGEDFPENIPDDRRYDAVYDTSLTFARQDKESDKFIITGQYSASVSSTFSIGFNVVENSVEVYLGGNRLTPGSDYIVDYNIGQVTILNDAALVPGADLRITYEQNDLFALASKTLIGLRGLYEFSERTRIGFSFLNLNQQTLSDKVRIGEEPLNNSIFGVDMETSFDLPFVTNTLDNIISTSEMSSISLKGEYAYINPDPNTKKSTITSDDNKSIAYIDDFEGAKRIIPVGVNYGIWMQPSPPQRVPGHDISITPDSLMNYKAQSYWYNVLPGYTNVKDIWPEREVSSKNETITVLEWIYNPSNKGMYNWYPSIDRDPHINWGGMMTPLSSTANNLIEENIEFIEFWLQMPSGVPEGTELNIDLGQISEDIIPNRRFDTEDKNQNDLIDEGEDTGIDGLFDEDEPGYDPVNNPDPSGDNYEYAQGSGNYSKINGLEGNAVSIDAGRLPDSEDMNRNLTLDNVNSYFRYTVPVNTDKEDNPFIQGGGTQTNEEEKNWYLFRIPLKDFTDEVGNPSLQQIEAIRLWISGISQPVYLKFAEFNLVGSQWRKVLDPARGVDQNDEVLEVATVSIEENPGEYTSPPGVVRERDRTNPDEQVLKNEQSLSLILKDLRDGDRREILKDLYKPLDLFNYKEMKMFVHGDEYQGRGSVSYYQDGSTYGSELYFRFGTDTSNFYEYRQPVRAGWNEIRMIFDQLTTIKQQRPVDQLDEVFRVPVPDLEGASYGVKGEPTLTKVKFFIIGIENPRYAPDGSRPDNFGEPVSGEIWVNELRVLDAEDTPGWAYTANTSFKFADLMKVDFNISQTNPYFHKLSDRFGNRVDSRNWGLNVNFDVLKLFPFNMQGSNLSVNFSRRESFSKPLYLPGTDINVEQAVSELVDNADDTERARAAADSLRFVSQTFQVTDTWTLSNIRFVIPSDFWLIEKTINNLSMGFNYNITKSRNPTIKRTENWGWNGNINYSLNFSPENYFKPVDIPFIGDVLGIFNDYEDVKVFFSPQSFETSIKASRKRSFSLSRTDSAKPNIQRDFTTTRGFGFNWKLTEGGFFNFSLRYNVDIQSSLTYLLTREVGRTNEDEPILAERTESEIWNEIFSGAMFGQDYNLNQSFDLTANPKFPSLWGIDRYFSVTAGYSVAYSWKNNLSQPDIGRSAGWSNRINAGMTLRLKDLVKPLFEEDTESTTTTPRGRGAGRGGRRGGERDVDSEISNNAEGRTDQQDTTAVPDDLREFEDDSSSPISQAFSAIKWFIRYTLFDYDQIRFDFSQNNSFSGSGLRGEGTGFNNFWGFSQDESRGPSRLFMLGLEYDIGPRAQAPGSNLSDNFSQKNSIDFSTQRPLWEGAQIDLKWRVGWGINKTTTIQIDDDGNAFISNLNSTGSIDRSFFSLPDFFLFPFADNGIVKVAELYNPEAEDRSSNLSEAFIEGFETLPLLAQIPVLNDVMKYIPRPNWLINWSGLEKISFFENVAKRISLRHAYNSSYSEGWKVSPDGLKQIQTQKITYGFSPLVGINVTFDEILDGDMTGSIQYSTTSNYSLGTTTRNITEGFSKDISFTASYSKSGFEIPLFGVSLKNDLEVSLSYTTAENSTVIFEMDNFNEEGTPQDGNIRTTIEPRIKYVMSSRVTTTLFYRRTQVEPKGSSRIPPTTTNEMGLEVHISIQ